MSGERMYQVVKVIRGRPYAYAQRTWRENGKVKTKSVYIGALDEAGAVLPRRRCWTKRDDETLSYEDDLDHAMVMVERWTGRTVEQQLAEIEAYDAGAKSEPVITVTAATEVAGEQPGASKSAEAEAAAETSTDVGEENQSGSDRGSGEGEDVGGDDENNGGQ